MNMNRPLPRPWIVHLASFICMVVLASPVYRPRGPGPGWMEHGFDSVVMAVKMPVVWVTAFVPSQAFEILLLVLVWGFAFWPLYPSMRTGQKAWMIRAYLVLIPLWCMYAIGWLFTHLGAVH